MTRLKELDAREAAARANPISTAQPSDELVEKASSWGNFGGSATVADWTWWSTNFCNSHAYRCETGRSGDVNFIYTNAYISYWQFNESATTNSRQLLLWDPCYDASIFDFCTSPFKAAVDVSNPPRTWRSIFSYNDHKYRWSPHGDGPLWGWSVVFDNPRTWPPS
jgi:hypothetical protein